MIGELTVERTYKIMTPDHKVKWEFDKRVVSTVGGREFVKLARSGYGFAKLVFHKCQDIPQPAPPWYSLSASRGYDDLIKMRNELQSDHLVAKDRDNIPELFRAAAKVAPKPTRQSRGAKAADKINLGVLELTLPGIVDNAGEEMRIDVVRPVDSTETLRVLLDPTTLTHVIRFLQAGAWSEERIQKKRKHVPDSAPKGVFARTDRKGHRFFIQKQGSSHRKVREGDWSTHGASDHCDDDILDYAAEDGAVDDQRSDSAEHTDAEAADVAEPRAEAIDEE